MLNLRPKYCSRLCTCVMPLPLASPIQAPLAGYRRSAEGGCSFRPGRCRSSGGREVVLVVHATTLVWGDVADDEPPEFVAVTTARSVLPASPDCRT